MWVCVIIVSSLSNLVRNTFPDCCDVSDFKVFKVSVVMTTTPKREREREKKNILEKKECSVSQKFKIMYKERDKS